MRSMKNVDNRSQLQQQIDYRKYKEDMEKQEAYLADKQTQYMEKLHQQVTISSLYMLVWSAISSQFSLSSCMYMWCRNLWSKVVWFETADRWKRIAGTLEGQQASP